MECTAIYKTNRQTRNHYTLITHKDLHGTRTYHGVEDIDEENSSLVVVQLREVSFLCGSCG